jgi:succinate dehydrogenase / fumarate reductase membrane anchor subunit
MAMVKSVLGVNHRGLTDWLIQRVSALVMAFYSVGLLIFFVTHAPLTYADWHDLFVPLWMKVVTLLVLTSLLYHAWIGMWTVFTDYVKPFVLRLALHVLVLLALVAFFFEGALILWGV